MTTGKTIALTIWTFVGKVISLLQRSKLRLGEVESSSKSHSKCKGPNLEMKLVCLRTRKSVRLLWEVKPSDADEVGKDQML